MTFPFTQMSNKDKTCGKISLILKYTALSFMLLLSELHLFSKKELFIKSCNQLWKIVHSGQKGQLFGILDKACGQTLEKYLSGCVLELRRR